MTDEEIWIEEIQKDKKRIEQLTAILDKVVERLKNGEKVSEIDLRNIEAEQEGEETCNTEEDQ